MKIKGNNTVFTLYFLNVGDNVNTDLILKNVIGPRAHKMKKNGELLRYYVGIS